jgi:hypothetical protein
MRKQYISRIIRKITPQMIIDSTRPVRNRLEIGIKERIQKRTVLFKITRKIFGPLYRTNHQVIELNITFNCNLKCFNCARSCRQAPDKADMSIDQIERFIKESENMNRKWRKIVILGGEPTLHPDLLKILELLISYKKQNGNKTTLELVTNGFGSEVKDVLSKIRPEILIKNTEKKSAKNNFWSINVAPVDLADYAKADYSNKCLITKSCGVALTKYGYYFCSNAAGIDRVFGFDIARKKLPPDGDEMVEQAVLLCRYCGRFKVSSSSRCIVEKEEMSLSWINAYKKFYEQKPILADY